MPDRRIGTVTFLFTNIEGSTWLWEQQHDMIQTGFRRQEAILHQVIASQAAMPTK